MADNQASVQAEDQSPVSVQEFAKRVKEKYPDYKDVDDLTLATKMVEKYPEYKDRVQFDQQPIPSGPITETQPVVPERETSYIPEVVAGGKSLVSSIPATQPNLSINTPKVPKISDSYQVPKPTVIPQGAGDQFKAIDQSQLEKEVGGAQIVQESKPTIQPTESQKQWAENNPNLNAIFSMPGMGVFKDAYIGTKKAIGGLGTTLDVIASNISNNITGGMQTDESGNITAPWEKGYKQDKSEFYQNVRKFEEEIPVSSGGATAFIGQLLPQTAALAATVLLRSPAASKAYLASMYGSSFGNGVETYDDYIKETGKQENPIDRYLVGMGYGAAEYIGEKIGLDYFLPKGYGKLVSKSLDASPQMAKEIGKSVLENYARITKQPLSSVIKKVAISSQVEGGQEVATELMDIAIDKWLTGKDVSGQEIRDRLVESYGGGALMGAGIAPFASVSQNAATSQRRKDQGTVTISIDEEGLPVEIIETEDKVFGIRPDGEEVKNISEATLNKAATFKTDVFENAIKEFSKTNKITTATIEGKQYTIKNPEDLGIEGKPIFGTDETGKVQAFPNHKATNPVTQTLGEIDQAQQVASDQQKLMEGIDPTAQVSTDESEGDIRLINFSNGQSKIITPEGEVIANNESERDKILEAAINGEPLPQPKVTEVGEVIEPAPERKVITQTIGNTPIDIIEGEEFDEVVPTDKVPLEKAYTALEKKFKDNKRFKVVAEKVQIEEPGETKYDDPIKKTVIKSIKIVPVEVLKKQKQAETDNLLNIVEEYNATPQSRDDKQKAGEIESIAKGLGYQTERDAMNKIRLFDSSGTISKPNVSKNVNIENQNTENVPNITDQLFSNEQNANSQTENNSQNIQQNEKPVENVIQTAGQINQLQGENTPQAEQRQGVQEGLEENVNAIPATDINVGSKKQKQKSNSITGKAKEIEVSQTDPKDLALKYFVDGGMVTSDDVLKLFNGSNGERLARMSYTSNENGLSIAQIAHNIEESLPESVREGLGAMDVFNAVEDVINSYNSPVSMAKTLLSKYSIDENQGYSKEWLDQQLLNEESERLAELELWSNYYESGQLPTENELIELFNTEENEQKIDNGRIIESNRPVNPEGNVENREVLQGSKPSVSEEIESAASEVNTNPSEAQKEAGNYKKGHVTIQGMDITIENPKGSFRKGVDENGKAWETELKSHYGYFKRTEGKDGDHIDTFIGSNPESQMIFVVDQNNPKTGKFDESKVMTGFNSVEEAKQAYLANYQPDWKGFGSITPVPVDQFKEWLNDGAKQHKPFSEYKDTPEPVIIPDVSTESDQVQDVAGQDSGQRPAVIPEVENKEVWLNKPNKISGVFPNSAIQVPVFHGSRTQFDDFDESLIGKNDPGVFGKGIYFSENKSNASQYGGADYANVKAYEVDIQKPYIVNFNDEVSVREARKLLSGKEIPAGYDGVIVYESGKMNEVVVRSKSQLKRITTDEDIWNAYDEGRYEQAIKDGILTEEQAKEIVESSGIEYKPQKPILEVLPEEKQSDVRFRVSPIEDENNLVAVHNIKPEGLLNADRLGGLPMPSIAIIDVNNGFNSYGEITLIADKDFVDPKKNKSAKVFASDVYSARYPSISHELPKQGNNKLIKKVNDVVPEEMSAAVINGIKNAIDDGGLSKLNYSDSAKVLFLSDTQKPLEIKYSESKIPESIQKIFIDNGWKNLEYFEVVNNDDIKKQLTDLYFEKDGADKEVRRFLSEDGFLNGNLMRNFIYDVKESIRSKGKVDTYATRRAADNYVRENNLQDEFESYIRKLYNELGVEEKIYRGYSNSGNRLYSPHTLSNVLKEMKKSGIRGGENFGYGAGNIRAKVTPEFKSLKDIQSNRGRITQFDDDIKDLANQELIDVMDAIKPFYKFDSGSFGYYDNNSDELVPLARSGRSESFNQLDSSSRKMVIDFLNKLANMPTEYFEAKINRGVSLAEFKNALIPSDTSKDVRDVLKFNGINAIEYTDNEDRTEKLKQITEDNDLRFRILGETGAANLDKAEEATTRLDNLTIAREMESGIKDIFHVDKKYEPTKGGFYLRFTEEPFIDLNHKYSRWYMDDMELENAIDSGLKEGKDYFKDEDSGEYFKLHTGLSGHYLDAETLEDAIKEVEAKKYWYRNSEQDDWSIFESNDEVRVQQDTPEGSTFYPDKVLFERNISKPKDAKSIRLATGWEKGVDGKWRYEVDDSDISFDKNIVAELRDNQTLANKVHTFSNMNYRKNDDGTYDFSMMKKGATSTSEFATYRNIPDSDLEFIFDNNTDLISKIRNNEGGEGFIGANMDEAKELLIEFEHYVSGGTTLGSLIENKDVFKSYPQLKKVIVVFDPNAKSEGSFSKDNGFLGENMGSQDVITVKSLSGARFKSVLLHEIQHAIQEIEGFAKGGNIESQYSDKDLTRQINLVESVIKQAQQKMNKDKSENEWLYSNVKLEDYIGDFTYKIPKSDRETVIEWANNLAKASQEDINQFLKETPNQKYLRLAGEVESRNVQTRMNMTPEERRNTLLQETEDVAREDQIVLMEGLGVSNFQEPVVGENINVSEKASSDLSSRPNVVKSLVKISEELGEPVNIINSSEIPEKVGKLKKQITSGNRVPAFFYNGKIYLLSDQITSVSDALKSYLHELIVHKGLRDVFADADKASIIGKQYAKFNDLMSDVFASMSRSQKIEIASKYAPGLYNKNGKIMHNPTIEEKALIGEEFLAHVSENQEIYDEPTLTRWQLFINRLGQIIRKAFRLTSNQFSQKDLLDIVRESRARIKSKSSAGKSSQESMPLFRATEKSKDGKTFQEIFQERHLAIQDLKSSGVKRIQINSDGTVTVYHGTSKSNWNKIQNEGFSRQSYFSVHKTGTQYGDSPLDVAKRKFGNEGIVVEVKIDPRHLSSAASGSELYAENALIPKDGHFEEQQSQPNTILIDGVPRPTLNSNGKPISNSEEGIRNFWKWFGDSKVVDAEGRPLVVYHGTLNNFDEFIPTKGINGKLLNRGTASWFSPHSEVGRNYAGKTGSVIEAYLKITNPKIAKSYIEIGTINSDKIAEYKSEGYDGAYFNPDLSDIFLSKENEEYVVFASSQIKSATGNTGSFNPESNDIRFRVEQTIEDLNKINSLPKSKLSDLLKSVNEDVEASMAEAHGIKATPLWERIKAKLTEIKESAQHFQHITESEFPVVYDKLRQFEAIPDRVKKEAYERISEVIRPIVKNKQDFEAFERYIVLQDLVNDIENTELFANKELPWGYNTVDEIKTDMRNVRTYVMRNPAVLKAIRDRQAMMKEVKQALVDNKLLKDNGNDKYFHHQVLAYMEGQVFPGVSSKDVRNHKKGWQRSRQGSIAAYNTNYLESEFEVLAQSLEQVAIKNILGELGAKINIMPELVKQSKNEGGSWRDYIPEGYKQWFPKQGTNAYKAASIAEKAVQNILNDPDSPDVSQFIAEVEGSMWVIPEQVAKQLDSMKDPEKEMVFPAALRFMTGKWKQWILLNPYSAIKYNFNNTSGDLDVVMAYNPAILKPKYAKSATTEAWNNLRGKGMSQDMKEALQYGIITSGLSIQEIPDVNQQTLFKAVTRGSENIAQKLWGATAGKYWGSITDLSQLRENVLRLASYKFFKEQIEAGKKPFGASDHKAVEALYKADTDPKEIAGKLARELMGDYGNLSQAGQWFRSHSYPFWSWVEINSPRYYRLLKNTKFEGNTGTLGRVAGVGAAKTAVNIGKLGVKAMLLMGLVVLWNRSMFPDEDDELQKQKDHKLKLIVGRREDGSIMTMKVQGAFSDVLSFFGLEDAVADVEQIKKGKSTVGKKAAEGANAFANKFLQGAMPLTKTLAEVATKKSFYPDVLNPRPIRDRAEQGLRIFKMDKIYNYLTHKPSRPFGKEVSSLLVYDNNPGEAAYYAMRQNIFDFMKDNGEEFPSGEPTDRSNALYYYKQSLKLGDPEKAEFWFDKYKELGGTIKGYTASMKKGMIINTIPNDLKAKWFKSLDAEDKEVLEMANKWYLETYLKLGTPKKGTK